MILSGRDLRPYVASLFVAIVLAVSPAAQSADALSAVRIDNFGKVNANYYRGAQPEGRDYEQLAALGIKTLINLTSDDATPDESAHASRAGMKYVQIPMTTHEPPTAEQLAQFLQIVNDPASQPVFVHCVGGRHRTGVMTAAYRITHDGWTSDKAFGEMKHYKYGADFLHPEFKTFIYDYPDARSHATPAVTALKAVS